MYWMEREMETERQATKATFDAHRKDMHQICDAIYKHTSHLASDDGPILDDP